MTHIQSRLRAPQADTHDRLLDSLPPPQWLTSGSLKADRWTITTDDPSVRRRATVDVRFDTVIAPGEMLSDPKHRLDLLSAKLLLYWAFDPRYGKVGSALTAGVFLRNYLQFVRWRLATGLMSNSEMTWQFWEEFFDQVSQRGPTGILPLHDRALAFIADIKSGKTSAPEFCQGDRTFFDFEACVRALGVANGRQLPQPVRLLIRKFAVEQGYSLFPYQLRSFGTDEPGGAANLDDLASGVLPLEGEPEGLTVSRLQAFFMPVAFLWTIRDRMAHDPLGANPLNGAQTVSGQAEAIARNIGGRTLTVPPLQACWLINAALTWVHNYSGEIQKAVEIIERAQSFGAEYSSAVRRVNRHFAPSSNGHVAGSPWPLYPAYFPGPRSISEFEAVRPTLRTVLYEYLAVACMIVIAAFSARRIEEIESLRDDSLKIEGDETWLYCWIGKTIRDIDRIPVPQSVASAVETLLWLSATARQNNKTRWIFDFVDAINPASAGRESKKAGFNVYRSLKRFSRFVGVPPLADGSLWVPKPHQFRRFFGIVYYHRYRFRHLTALSRFYRHFDPDRTRLYISEAAAGSFLRQEEEIKAKEGRGRVKSRFDKLRIEDFDEAGLGFRAERFLNVAKGVEDIGGWGGEAIRRQLDQLVSAARSSMNLGPAEDMPDSSLGEIVASFARGQRLEPNALGHSYCKCSKEPQDLISAACLKERSTAGVGSTMLSAPDPTFAADTVCSSCPHNVQFDECRPYWDDMVKHESAQSECALSPLLAALSRGRAQVAADHIARCFSSNGNEI